MTKSVPTSCIPASVNEASHFPPDSSKGLVLVVITRDTEGIATGVLSTATPTVVVDGASNSKVVVPATQAKATTIVMVEVLNIVEYTTMQLVVTTAVLYSIVEEQIVTVQLAGLEAQVGMVDPHLVVVQVYQLNQSRLRDQLSNHHLVKLQVFQNLV